MKRILAKSTAIASEISAMRAQFRRQPLMKKPKAIEIKWGGIRDAAPPDRGLQIIRSRGLQNGFLQARRRDFSPDAFDITGE